MSQPEAEEAVHIPSDLPDEDVLFSSFQLIPDGKAEGIRYIIFVDPTIYRQISDKTIRLQIGRSIGHLNKILENTRFIIMGPGRWGSSNIDLGVRVSYADIHNTCALVEMAVASEDGVPALSYGTHFYQDLVETGVYSLPLHLHDEQSRFKWAFFQESENCLAQLSPADSELAPYLKVIDVAAVAEGKRLTILMDGSNDEAVGYLVEGDWKNPDGVAGSISTF